ncbi:MAG: hypothetical protein WC136_08090 [Sphaerochaeta sp.]
MKKFAKSLLATVLVALAASSLFAATATDTAVLRLHAYIPEKTTFIATDYGFEVASNAYNFTYSVQEQDNNKTLFVVAN